MIIRTANIDAKWDCVSNKGYISKPHLVNVNIKDTYKNTPSEDLSEWAQRVADEITKMMCKRACGSLSDSVYCNDIFPDIITSNQIGKSEDEIEKIEIPVTIDEQPTHITIKHDLSTMDIVQISRLQKSISKLEKIRQEQQEQLSLYDERIRVNYDLFASIQQRNEWLNKINMTNIKIQKQKDAIEHIKR